MMPLGHLGIPLLLIFSRRDPDIDVRLLMLGSILPDLIDKPLGHLIFPEDNGRIFAHSLLFVIVLVLIGLRSRNVMTVALGSGIHQLLDGMFLDPVSSLWPLLGPFKTYDFEVYQWLDAFKDPYVITEELIGLALLLMLVWKWKLFIPDNMMTFLKRGKITGLQKAIYKKDME